jgi:hypothetical protein
MDEAIAFPCASRQRSNMEPMLSDNQAVGVEKDGSIFSIVVAQQISAFITKASKLRISSTLLHACSGAYR